MQTDDPHRLQTKLGQLVFAHRSGMTASRPMGMVA